MGNKYKYLAKNMLLFSIGNFVPKLLSLVLIPIYTKKLTTVEFGVYDLLTTTIQLLIPILTLDIQDAVMRFSLDDKCNNDDVLSTAFCIILSGTGIVSLAAIITSFLDIPALNKSYLFFCSYVF